MAARTKVKAIVSSPAARSLLMPLSAPACRDWNVARLAMMVSVVAMGAVFSLITADADLVAAASAILGTGIRIFIG